MPFRIKFRDAIPSWNWLSSCSLAVRTIRRYRDVGGLRKSRVAGGDSMMIVVLIAGLGVLLAGLLAIAYGIPIKEFGFGNTLIVTGAVAACTGAMMLVLWIVVRELKDIARGALRKIPAEAGPGNTLRLGDLGLGDEGAEDDDFLFGRETAAENAGSAESFAQSPQWQSESLSRDQPRQDTPAGPQQAAKPRRNLLFSSSRREREEAAARASEPSMAAPAARPADAQRRGDRATLGNSGAAASADRHAPPAAQSGARVTVLKSGVVDGMAYSLYSDGSIEAQMPEGMMRFGSIDELRAHLDQRP